ncbi:MAG: SDR family oxidoreductase [Hyphomicrobiaceae bacterium]|nr:SDR family oxidoreductase [Hyphomicrobiaceae bacterium]
MRVLLVGGNGYLGPVVGATLRKLIKPDVLDAMDTQWFTATALEPWREPFSSIGEIDKREIGGDILRRYDVVVDFAAVSNDPMSADFEAATMEINHQAAVDLARRAKAAGVKRFIFASSCSIYGSAGDGAKSEQDPKGPLTAYAKSKWAGEVDLEPLADERFSVIALRFATACGWSPTLRADLVLNDFVATALTERKILVLSDGTPWRPLIHTKDIGRAVAWASQVAQEGFAAYNVGSNAWTLTIGELAKNVGEILGVPYEISGAANADKRSYRVAFDKYEATASAWLPQEKVGSAVEEMREMMGKHMDRFVNFRKSNLIRLNVLRAKLAAGELDSRLFVRGKGV